MPHSLVIINPNASRTRDPAARRALRDQLDEVLTGRDGHRPHILETAGPGDTRPAVEAAVSEGVSGVVGVGGDGTLRAIATFLSGTGVPLGIVPAGTGNQLAAVMGIPLAPATAVAALTSARPRTIDLGEATWWLTDEQAAWGAAGPPVEAPSRSSAFAIGCGAGFDARLMATTPPDLKRRIGRSAYFAQALRLAADIGVVPYRLTVDGQTIETEASIALIGNMGHLVPGVLAPRLPIVPDDGLLDLIVVGARGPLQGMKGLLDQLLRTSLGGGQGSDSLRVRGRRIGILADRAEPLQVDGDHVGWGWLEARIVPAALRVLVPAGSSPGA